MEKLTKRILNNIDKNERKYGLWWIYAAAVVWVLTMTIAGEAVCT